MFKKLILCFSNVLTLQSFTLFPEYFLSICLFYILIIVVVIIYGVSGLTIEKSLSECFVLILAMIIYLLINDELLQFVFLNYNNSIINDFFSVFAKILICIFSMVFFLMISNFLKAQKLTSFEYLLNVFFSILGLMLICCCSDFLIAYLSIELCSLAFYVLASFKKMSSYSVESGIKYFIVGAIASAFFLLGVSFIYVLTGSITFFDCQNFFGSSVIYFDPYGLVNERLLFLQIVPFCNSSIAEFGLTLILFSLFIKLALAPFHLWSLDVFEGSPTSSTFFFAAITKLSILVLLI